MLESAGVAGTRSPSSQSFRSHPAFIPIERPALGCIVVYWRGSKGSGQGHVGFYGGENATHVWTLGGNESDMVQDEALPKESATFGLVGPPCYFWPRSVTLPAGGPIMLPAGTPTSIKTPGGVPDVPSAPPPTGPAPVAGRQIGITATVFGGAADRNTSAYDGHVITDTEMGVALPFRFAAARAVRVIGPHGTAEGTTVDVGPWNTHDPYWDSGLRPQSESGIDTRGRKTSKAGIDLTPAMARAVGIDGKGLVDWQFVTQPAAPAVT
jgi:hypothetical protein